MDVVRHPTIPPAQRFTARDRFALVVFGGAASVVQAVSAQQIDAFDRPWGVGEPDRDPFSLPDAGDRSEAEFGRDAVIEVRPVIAIDAFESTLAVAVAQHQFSV